MKTGLYAYMTGTLDSNGAGLIKVGPASAREVWVLDVINLKGKPNPVNDARCSVYVGLTPTQDYYVDQSFRALTGDQTQQAKGRTVKVGEYVWAQWNEGDTGSYISLTVTGERIV